MEANDAEYKDWLLEIKAKIRSTQIKAVRSINNQLIALYWDLGEMIVIKQGQSRWGEGLLEQIAKDLKKEFPDTAGFSRSNLYSIRQFYVFYKDSSIVQQSVGQTGSEIIQQPVGQINVPNLLTQIPWGHHVLILNKIKDTQKAVFYIQKTIENNWSRNILGLQISSSLFQRQGKAISNFKNTLPTLQGDLAQQTLKDPYIFDFLQLEGKAQEANVEKKLIDTSLNSWLNWEKDLLIWEDNTP